MTAKKLYACDDTFRALIDLWVTEKRIPYPTADRLRDAGLWEAAVGADWAFNEPDRPQFVYNSRFSHYDSGPYPNVVNYRSEDVYWYDDNLMRWANCLPLSLWGFVRKYSPHSDGYGFPSATTALLALLDGFADFAKAGHTLPTVTVGVIG